MTMTHLIATGMMIALAGTTPLRILSPVNPSPTHPGININQMSEKSTLKHEVKIAGYYDRYGVWHYSDGSAAPCRGYSNGYCT
jgi:hypothetical protein